MDFNADQSTLIHANYSVEMEKSHIYTVPSKHHACIWLYRCGQALVTSFIPQEFIGKEDQKKISKNTFLLPFNRTFKTGFSIQNCLQSLLLSVPEPCACFSRLALRLYSHHFMLMHRCIIIAIIFVRVYYICHSKSQAHLLGNFCCPLYRQCT